jgi:hypothetical protein
MPEDGPAFEFEVKIQRGNGTDDRDTYKTKVSADSIDELDDKVEQARDKLAEWAADFREIQPQEKRRLSDDQATLDGGESGV